MFIRLLALIFYLFNPIGFLPEKYKDVVEESLADKIGLDKLDPRLDIFKKLATFDSYLFYLLTWLVDKKNHNASLVHMYSSGFTYVQQINFCDIFQKIHCSKSSKFSNLFVLSSLERIRYLMYRDLANFMKLSSKQRLELCSMVASISVDVNKLKDIIDELKSPLDLANFMKLSSKQRLELCSMVTSISVDVNKPNDIFDKLREPLQNAKKLLLCKDIIHLEDESFSEKFTSFVSSVKSTDMSENDVRFYTMMCAQYKEVFFHITVLLALQSEY